MVSVAVVAPLSPAERAEFAKQRAIVLEHVDGYVTCGLALRTIQQGRLYRETHDTLADWCIAEIGLSRGRVYQLMDAAEVCQTMLDIGAPTPKNARQAAELKRVPEEHRVEVMEAVDARGDMSARAIQEEAAARGVSKNETTAEVSKIEIVDGDSWSTPDWMIDIARDIMGGIDCDPSSHALAQNVVQAGTWYGKEQNGLKQIWHGRVWFNFPYSQPLMDDFTEQLLLKWKIKETHEATGVSNAQTSTDWYHATARACSVMANTGNKIGFWHPELGTTVPKKGNRNAQTVWYFGENINRFLHHCEAQGWLPLKVVAS